jgi:hypothetical protein
MIRRQLLTPQWEMAPSRKTEFDQDGRLALI